MVVPYTVVVVVVGGPVVVVVTGTSQHGYVVFARTTVNWVHPNVFTNPPEVRSEKVSTILANAKDGSGLQIGFQHSFRVIPPDTNKFGIWKA